MKEKRETDKISLEAEQKKASLVKDFLERRKTLNSSELDLAKKEKELFKSRIQAYEMELDLAQKREARD